MDQWGGDTRSIGTANSFAHAVAHTHTAQRDLDYERRCQEPLREISVADFVSHDGHRVHEAAGLSTTAYP